MCWSLCSGHQILASLVGILLAVLKVEHILVAIATNLFLAQHKLQHAKELDPLVCLIDIVIHVLRLPRSIGSGDEILLCKWPMRCCFTFT